MTTQTSVSHNQLFVLPRILFAPPAVCELSTPNDSLARLQPRPRPNPHRIQPTHARLKLSSFLSIYMIVLR